jgi:DNA polymerase III alpha subunit (gram-positive type)
MACRSSSWLIIRCSRRVVNFVGDAPIVADNAGFDTAFLNAELKRAAKPPIATAREIDPSIMTMTAALAD